ncbi:MAG: hypothetical protein GW778_00395 [Alphaproteobacteria bacterium]|nr:hypothetical protein [Alphaproteobacteria bacterium]
MKPLIQSFSTVPMFNPTRAPAHEGLGGSFANGNSSIVQDVDPAAVDAAIPTRSVDAVNSFAPVLPAYEAAQPA